MKWSRIKSIIILILIIANAFLLMLVAAREVRSARLEREARSAAVAVLERNGIAVDEAALPDSISLQPCQVERDRAGERALAEKLLGDVKEEERGGGVYRYVSNSGKGSIQFHSGGDFSAAFSAKAYPLPDGQTMEEHAAALMASVGFDGEVYAAENGSVMLRQLWQGIPLYDCTLRLNYEDGALRSITEGRRLIGTPAPGVGAENIDVPTALIHFLNERNELGDVCNRIVRMEAGYVMTASLSGPARLVPIWWFETETGAYRMDAVTGDFSRADRAA